MKRFNGILLTNQQNFAKFDESRIAGERMSTEFTSPAIQLRAGR